MKNFSFRLLCALALLAIAGTPAYAAPVLIGNKNIATEKFDGPTLKSIFLGKKVTWDGAGRVTLAVLKGAVDMTASAFNNHWRRLAMTGGGTAPKAFDKEDELRKFVAETPGAVGFVDSATADASVVVLKTTS